MKLHGRPLHARQARLTAFDTVTVIFMVYGWPLRAMGHAVANPVVMAHRPPQVARSFALTSKQV